MEAAPLSPKQAEQLLVSEILNHLAYLLMAESPNKSKVKEAADRYRGQLLASLDPVSRATFLRSRDIIIELAKLLARCKDRETLGKTFAYINDLSRGEVLIVADDTSNTAMQTRLFHYLRREFEVLAVDSQLIDIINIVHNLNPVETNGNA